MTWIWASIIILGLVAALAIRLTEIKIDNLEKRVKRIEDDRRRSF
jgi:hypothetical protein